MRVEVLRDLHGHHFGAFPAMLLLSRGGFLGGRDTASSLLCHLRRLLGGVAVLGLLRCCDRDGGASLSELVWLGSR